MTQLKYTATQGPWETVGGPGPTSLAVCAPGGGDIIAEIVNGNVADRNIMAASWGLLRALKGARLFVYAQMGVQASLGRTTDHFRNELAEYEAAIAAAEGE